MKENGIHLDDFADDGTFWMPLEKFVEIFTNVSVTCKDMGMRRGGGTRNIPHKNKLALKKSMTAALGDGDSVENDVRTNAHRDA